MYLVVNIADTISTFSENMGHPVLKKIVIIKKCPKLLRIYGNTILLPKLSAHPLGHCEVKGQGFEAIYIGTVDLSITSLTDYIHTHTHSTFHPRLVNFLGFSPSLP